MKFLANENFPFPSIRLLREAGYEVISIGESYHGISDKAVIEFAQEEGLIILTFDRDYGEIIFKYHHQNPPAVVYFRFKGEGPEYAGLLLLDILFNNKLTVEGIFTVVEKGNIRQRRY